jgi:hypothetical protein
MFPAIVRVQNISRVAKKLKNEKIIDSATDTNQTKAVVMMAIKVYMPPHLEKLQD